MDPYLLAQRNAFVTHAVDRDHVRRIDKTWLSAAHSDPATRYLVVWHDQVLVQDGNPACLARLRQSEVDGLREHCTTAMTPTVLLGRLGGVIHFGVELAGVCDAVGEALVTHGRLVDLRGAASLLNAEDGALAAQMKAMLHWQRQQSFCGRCGAPTAIEEAGYLARCTRRTCGQLSFPRVDPAIIVLVTACDRCLLGRQPRWPVGRYSNIAGFVEPGESLETAVAREVREETSIAIDSLAYHSSQPWPFPQSLMVGFTARASSLTISLGDGELEDAQWFTREAIRDGLLTGILGLPSPYSISYHLIEDWFDAGDCGPLAELIVME